MLLNTMCVICLSDHKTPAMYKLFYFVLNTYHMIPKWIKDAEDNYKNSLTQGVKNILEDKKDSASVSVDSDGEDNEQYE